MGIVNTDCGSFATTANLSMFYFRVIGKNRVRLYGDSNMFGRASFAGNTMGIIFWSSDRNGINQTVDHKTLALDEANQESIR